MHLRSRSWLPSSTVVAYAGGYANPHANDRAELAALNAGLWEVSSDDFAAIAEKSSAGHLWSIDSFSDLLTCLSATPQRSIQKLYLVGHSMAELFSFKGAIEFPVRNGRLTSQVTWDRPAAVTKENLSAWWIAPRINQLESWNPFAPGAELIFTGCHSGSSGPGAAGGSELFAALSSAFKVCVRGFRHNVCVFLAHRLGRITARGNLKYDPTGRLTCRQLAVPPFLTIDRLVSDTIPACVGVRTSGREFEQELEAAAGEVEALYTSGSRA